VIDSPNIFRGGLLVWKGTQGSWAEVARSERAQRDNRSSKRTPERDLVMTVSAIGLHQTFDK
jgi:hypothetical protein